MRRSLAALALAVGLTVAGQAEAAIVTVQQAVVSPTSSFTPFATGPGIAADVASGSYLPNVSGNVPNQRRSPFEKTGAPDRAYQVLGAGNGGVGTATYLVAGPALALTWGSPDQNRNRIDFYASADASGTPFATVTGADIRADGAAFLGIPNWNATSTGFVDVVISFANGETFGSFVMSNAHAAAFEYAGLEVVPLPGAVVLLGTALVGLGAWRRRQARAAP